MQFFSKTNRLTPARWCAKSVIKRFQQFDKRIFIGRQAEKDSNTAGFSAGISQ